MYINEYVERMVLSFINKRITNVIKLGILTFCIIVTLFENVFRHVFMNSLFNMITVSSPEAPIIRANINIVTSLTRTLSYLDCSSFITGKELDSFFIRTAMGNSKLHFFLLLLNIL
jgi:hypothetical protein